MPYVHCPRCSMQLSAGDYPPLSHCPYCMARGMEPVPYLRRGLSAARVNRRITAARAEAEQPKTTRRSA